MNSIPLNAANYAVNSNLSLFPFLKLTSNTPALALPYPAGNAPVKKSELLSRLVFKALTGPPVAPKVEKWLGLGIATPSNLQSTPTGLFPRMTRSFLESLLVVAPAG